MCHTYIQYKQNDCFIKCITNAHITVQADIPILFVIPELFLIRKGILVSYLGINFDLNEANIISRPTTPPECRL